MEMGGCSAGGAIFAESMNANAIYCMLKCLKKIQETSLTGIGVMLGG
jgi:hypothetical protein